MILLHTALAICFNFFHPYLILVVTPFITSPQTIESLQEMEVLPFFFITSPFIVASSSTLVLPKTGMFLALPCVRIFLFQNIFLHLTVIFNA